MSKSNSKREYRVEFRTIVDHPENRNASYTPVPANTVVHTSLQFSNRTQAVRAFDEIRSGSYDAASEYVGRIHVVEITGVSYRWVRLPVERTRKVV